MLRQLKRKDFRVVYLAAILILGVALFAPPDVAYADRNGDPGDGVFGPKPAADRGPGANNSRVGSADAENRITHGGVYFPSEPTPELVVLRIEIPGIVTPIPIKISLPSWLDWGEQ